MRLLRVSAILGFLAVALGAFGTHSLKGHLADEMLKVWQTGTEYQLVHAVMACVCAAVCLARSSKKILIAGWLFVAGSIVFSGSLYALALTQIRVLGAVTPIGGLLMLGGWIMVVLYAPDLAKPQVGVGVELRIEEH